MTGGTGGTSSSSANGGVGGDINLKTGLGGTNSGASGIGGRGGNLTITLGTGGLGNGATQTGGKGGSLSVTGGTGGGNAVGAPGGDISLTSGTGTGGGTGGTVGVGGTLTLSAGTGGYVSSTPTGCRGGPAILSGGKGGGSVGGVGGTGGNLYLNPGTGGTGASGTSTNGFVGLAISTNGVAFGDVRVGTTNTPATGVSFSVAQSASVTSNLTVGGTNTAGYFVGNGGGLTNIPMSGVSNFLVSVTNVVTNIVQSATNNFWVTTSNMVQSGTNNFMGTATNIAAALTNGLGGGGITDRGDPSSTDFGAGNLTTDSAWHDLDLSGIVPAGTKAVILRYYIFSLSTGSDSVYFRKKGNSNDINETVINFNYTGPEARGETTVFLDSNLKAEYKFVGSSGDWDTINITAAGWFN